MKIAFTAKLTKDLKAIKKQDPNLYRKLQKQLGIFSEDPTHPSLRVHKLSGNLKDSWSISISRSFRIIYTQNKDKVTFFKFGTHDEVYERS